MMRRLLLTIQYDGTAYHGWQVQANALSVQEVVQDALEKIFGNRPDVKGCSRTDSGVHANMYCLTFDTVSDIPEKNILLAMNTYLPRDIAVLDCRETAADFHPRYHCRSKQYIYKIYNGVVRNPFLERYALHYRHELDASYLHQEAQAFLGTHDFRGFCSVKSDAEDTVRTVYSVRVYREGDMVFFEVEADGFLYNMVRIMVGTLLFVQEGKIPAGALPEVIASRARHRAGKTAAPQGLYLNKVNY